MSTRQMYLESHSSLQASMDDFEAREFSPTFPDIPSQNCGFRSGHASDYSEQSSRRSYSPPAWRKAGSGWFQHQSLSPSKSEFRSKEPSPLYHETDDDGDGDGDVTAYRIATRVPLPSSPTKERSPSYSPEPQTGPTAEEVGRGGGGGDGDAQMNAFLRGPDPPTNETTMEGNYFRFSTRLDVVQRTQPVEDSIIALRKFWGSVKKSRWNAFVFAMLIPIVWVLADILFSAPINEPVPDLIMVSGFAKTFEQAIYYSERGHEQVRDLRETGVAIWDLSESVRSTNMTSAPTIVRQLDELGESIDTLSMELTSFYSNVDGDIDNILIMMEWVQRELTVFSSSPPSNIRSLWSKTHGLLTQVGLVDEGQFLLGTTQRQARRRMMERVFNGYLNTLEECINSELTRSMRLFQLFENIDNQFLNIQRSVIREQDTQDQLENDFLSSLWAKVIGVNASKLRKYEKNKGLLASVRDETIRNKVIIVDHNQQLLELRSDLEMMRRRLVSPLVRSQNSSTQTIEEQIKGIEGMYVQLYSSREAQRRKLLDFPSSSMTKRREIGGGVSMVREPSLEARRG